MNTKPWPDQRKEGFVHRHSFSQDKGDNLVQPMDVESHTGSFFLLLKFLEKLKNFSILGVQELCQNLVFRDPYSFQ